MRWYILVQTTKKWKPQHNDDVQVSKYAWHTGTVLHVVHNFAKVLERHVHTLIMDHLHNHHPLSESQWGFEPGKSTITALLSTTHSWLTTLEEGKEIGAVFLDLQKAFESVPHKSLFEKLQQTGISHHIISWISDYLTSREQNV